MIVLALLLLTVHAPDPPFGPCSARGVCKDAAERAKVESFWRACKNDADAQKLIEKHNADADRQLLSALATLKLKRVDLTPGLTVTALDPSTIGSLFPWGDPSGGTPLPSDRPPDLPASGVVWNSRGDPVVSEGEVVVVDADGVLHFVDMVQPGEYLAMCGCKHIASVTLNAYNPPTRKMLRIATPFKSIGDKVRVEVASSTLDKVWRGQCEK